MKNGKKILALLCMVWMVGMMALPAAAEELTTTAQEPAAAEAQDESSVTGTKAVAAAVTIAAAATAGALAMGWSISKSSEAIARQPEAAGEGQPVSGTQRGKAPVLPGSQVELGLDASALLRADPHRH